MKRLEKLLPVGRAGALTARQLADLLETTPREVTRSIEAARRRGVPICSSVDPDNGGNYLAADADELAAYIWEREQRAQHIREPTMAPCKQHWMSGDKTKPPVLRRRQTISTEGRESGPKRPCSHYITRARLVQEKAVIF